jgi:S-adenosyl methyltransferase
VPGNWFRGMTPEGDELIKIDTSLANSARIYDYLLGGKDNFASDREAGDQMIEALPNVVSDPG